MYTSTLRRMRHSLNNLAAIDTRDTREGIILNQN